MIGGKGLKVNLCAKAADIGLRLRDRPKRARRPCAACKKRRGCPDPRPFFARAGLALAGGDAVGRSTSGGRPVAYRDFVSKIHSAASTPQSPFTTGRRAISP